MKTTPLDLALPLRPSRRMRTFLTLLLALLLPAGAHAQTADPIQAALDSHALEAATEDAPGVSIALLTADGQLRTAAHGAALSPDARFLSGSTGKTAAALLALQLVEEGRLDLDAPIADRFADRDWMDRLDPERTLTLRRLLNHSAGVPDYLTDIDFFIAGLFRPNRRFTPEQLLRFVSFDGLNGEAYAYSDTHYILVGLLIEQATGQGYYQLLQEGVLGPAGMTETSPLIGRTHERLVEGHGRGGDPTSRGGRLDRRPDHEWAAGGLVTTPADLARLYAALGRGVFSLEAAAMRAGINRFEPGGPAGYGFGVFVREYEDGGWRISHGGDFGGYRSAVLYDSRTGAALAIQANARAFEAPGSLFALFAEIEPLLAAD